MSNPHSICLSHQRLFLSRNSHSIERSYNKDKCNNQQDDTCDRCNFSEGFVNSNFHCQQTKQCCKFDDWVHSY